MGRRGRTRVRVRRRRRQILALLVEIAFMAALIGMFPRFHALLAVAGVAVGILVVYSGLLIRVRALEQARAELRRVHAVRAREAQPVAAPAPRLRAPEPERVLANGRIVLGRSSPFDDAISVVDEDVHVVVHRSDEVDLTELRAAAGAR